MATETPTQTPAELNFTVHESGAVLALIKIDSDLGTLSKRQDESWVEVQEDDRAVFDRTCLYVHPELVDGATKKYDESQGSLARDEIIEFIERIS